MLALDVALLLYGTGCCCLNMFLYKTHVFVSVQTGNAQSRGTCRRQVISAPRILSYFHGCSCMQHLMQWNLVAVAARSWQTVWCLLLLFPPMLQLASTVSQARTSSSLRITATTYVHTLMHKQCLCCKHPQPSKCGTSRTVTNQEG